MICPNCHREIKEPAGFCPYCGNQLPENTAQSQISKDIQSQTDFRRKTKESQAAASFFTMHSTRPLSKKGKHLVISISCITAILILTGSILCLFYQNEVKKQEMLLKLEEMKAENKLIEEENSYLEKVNTLMESMSYCETQLKPIGNMVAVIMYNNNYKIHDPQTDKYTLKDGEFYFMDSSAVLKYFEDSGHEHSSDMKTIRDKEWEMKELVKELENPPAGLEDCADYVSEAYYAYKIYSDRIFSTGLSLNSYMQNKLSAERTYRESYELAQVNIPEPKQVPELPSIDELMA